MTRNGGRAFALLHEGKRFLIKLLKDAEGFAADSFLKLYDRDDFDNTVLTASSYFSNEQPWFAVFMLLHLEDLHALFGVPLEDPYGLRWRLDFFCASSASSAPRRK